MKHENHYLDTRALAATTSTSASFWNQRRHRGDGPPYVKLGTRVIYNSDEVETWLEGQVKRSTSEGSK
jgi:predicted DNA-binding transcriptional regulator AlpA